MFAGPNGSGKSVLKSYLSPKLLGVYLNPDEIQRDIELSGFLDLSVFGVSAPEEEVPARPHYVLCHFMYRGNSALCERVLFIGTQFSQ